MPSRINEISPVLVDLEVEIPWEKVHKELESALTKVQKNARIRGYRQGKVPRNVVRQLLGKAVKEEVRTALVEEGLWEAIKEHDLEPVALPNYAPAEVVEGKPFNFSVKLEIRPKIASVDTSSLEVERVQETVTDQAVDDHIQMLRRNNAELVAPEPARPAQSGDVVIVDYKVTVEGKDRPELGATDRRFELGSHQLAEAFETGLLSASAGETKLISMRYAEDHVRKELRGTEAQIEVAVKEVREKRLPELDDEFAKDLSFDSLDKLKENVRSYLEAEAKRRTDSNLRNQLLEKLVAKNPIAAPPTLVAQQERAMLEDLVKYQQIIGNEAPVSDEIIKNLHEQAEYKVRAGFLLSQIARERKIEVTEENVEEKLNQLAEQRGIHPAKMRANYTEKMRQTLQAQMLEEKLIEHLLAGATIKETAKAPDSGPKEASP
jgi:trigger factor